MVGGEGELPVLLVHGGLSQAGEWALVAGESCAADSSSPTGPVAGSATRVGMRRVGLRRFGERWLTAMVDALGVDEVDVVGSSTGGYFGLVFALAHPDRVCAARAGPAHRPDCAAPRR